MRLRVALAAWLLAVPSSPHIDVTLRNERVLVRTSAAPLAEILGRLAQATGTRVIYETGRPTQLVSVAIDAGSVTEAIDQLLEGQGLNYALRLDPSGRKVEMLVISEAGHPGSPSTGKASARGRSSPPPQPPEPVVEDTPEEPDLGPVETEEPEAPPSAFEGVPAEAVAPDAPAGADVSPSPPSPAGPAPTEPQPPAPASQPQPVVPPPPPPSFPAPASQPGPPGN